MIHIGIDPGKEGAIAVLNSDGACIEVIPTPIIAPTGKGSKKGRPEYDLTAARDVLIRWRRAASLAGVGLFVTVEKLQPMPMQKGGTIANFNRGVSLGWAWMLTALGVPCQLVVPRKWQKAMHAGTSGDDTKQKSIAAAKRLFPNVDLKRTARSRTDHDGIAEALLLARYGFLTQRSTLPKASWE